MNIIFLLTDQAAPVPAVAQSYQGYGGAYSNGQAQAAPVVDPYAQQTQQSPGTFSHVFHTWFWLDIIITM